MKKRAFALLVLMLMLLTLLPQRKASATDVTNGSLSDTIMWQYADGILTITGDGEIEGRDYNSAAPWNTYKKEITKIVIGEGIRSTGTYTFKGLNEVKEIQFPTTLERIDFHSFQSCVSLQQIEIPCGVKEIEEGAFMGCKSLKSIVIPNSVETLGKEAFRDCRGLESVKLSEKLTSLGSCFYGCSSLTAITLPKSITSIAGTFEYCSSLTKVEILGNLKRIGYFTFHCCYDLESLDLPASVNLIESEAFNNCRALQYIRFNGDFPQVGERLLSVRSNNPCIVYYPVNNKTWTDSRKRYLLHCYPNTVVFEPFGTPECQHATQKTISGKPATCTEAGLSDGSACASCGKVLKAQTAIAALGHDLMTVTMAPNCTEPGFDLYQCSRCSHRETGNIVQPLGHDFGDWETINEPTLETAGLAQRVCATCGEMEQRELEQLSPPPTEPQPTEPVTQPTTQPTASEEPIQLVPAEPKDRALAGVGVVVVLLAVTAVILIVKWLTRKRT